MYTAFMMALTLTTVANVLVTMALAPLFTALMARFALGPPAGARAPGRPSCWPAWASPGCTRREVSGSDPRHLLGTLVALGVPIAAAVNWTLLQHNRGGDEAATCCPPC